MFQIIRIGLNQVGFWLAQVPAPDVVIEEPPEFNMNPDSLSEASVAITGPKFFIALIAGVLLAFAFQLLLTNLGVAMGLSAMKGSSNNSNPSPSGSSSPGAMIRKIENGVGIATLLSVSISLFVACWLAVELSLVEQDVGLGMIIGLVIWATYFCLLVWVSSTTVGSLVGSVVSTAVDGFQAILGTATSAIGGTGAAIGGIMGGMAAKHQTVSTAESAAKAVRRELTKDLDPETVREKFEDYVQTLRPPQLDYHRIQSEIEDLLNDPNFQQLSSGDLSKVDRQTFVDLVSSRSDLSKEELNRIVNILERVWSGAARRLPSTDRLGDMMKYVKEATPDQLMSSEFEQKLIALVDELRKQSQQQRQVKQAEAQAEGPLGILSQGVSHAMNSMVGMIVGRTDLSSMDSEKIIQQIKKVGGELSDQAGQVKGQLTGDTGGGYSPVKADVEDYLLNTYSWHMTRPNLEQEFREVIYDAEANPGAVRHELESLNRQYFVNLLRQRGVFTVERMNEIGNWLEAIRLEAITAARAAEEQGEAIALFTMVENYLLSTPKENLTPEKIQLNFRDILEDPNADYETISRRLAQFDRPTLERILSQRNDVTPVEVAAITTELEKARDRVLAESQEAQEAAKAKAEAQWLQVQSYLRDTGKEELNPQGIQQDLETLLDDPQAGMAALRARASHFDRDTLVQLLSERPEISEDQVNQVIDTVEAVWHKVRSTPSKLTGQAKAQYDGAMNAIADYLRNTGKDELNPEGIQQDLKLLLDNPSLGATAIRMRLSEVDRDTLVQLLSQRKDLSEEQVHQIINSVQGSLKSVAKAPRRLASRAQSQVMDFESSIEDYLRNTGKDELHPEGIKRDLQQLVNNPRAGMLSVRDRLSKFDQDTMVQLLAQRQDMSEEEARQAVGQIVSVRDQFMEQLQSAQRAVEERVNAIIDSILDSIRNYLNSLDRPELNYEGVKNDLQTLFDDPEAGFEALRARLSQFDRDTLIAIMGSSPFLSESDIHQTIDQVEHTRNRVLQRAERIQRKTEERIHEMQRQAEQAAEETRKAAKLAAWWLFGTAVVSAIASLLGGLLAVAT